MVDSISEYELGGEAPLDPLFARAMDTLAPVIDHVLNGDTEPDTRKIGYILMAFPFGEGPCDMVSNAAVSWDDALVVLKEVVGRLEQARASTATDV